MILIDTDICIELLRGNRHILEKRLACSAEIAVAFMTVAELFYGAEKSLKRKENLGLVDRFLLSVRVMHTDEEWMIAKTVCRVLGLTIEKENYNANEKV